MHWFHQTFFSPTHVKIKTKKNQYVQADLLNEWSIRQIDPIL